MKTKRFTIRALAGFTLLAGAAGPAAAQPGAGEVLGRKPSQPGVLVSTPDAAACRAEQMSWPKPANGQPAPTGVVVKDGAGKLVRQFVDTTGRNQPNIFSYYYNGAESYRELDTNGNGKPDQFRWLGANGSKWGEDQNGDGGVDRWFVLTPEELSQELLQVIVTKDGARLSALLPKADELKQAGFPDGEIAKIQQRAAGVGQRVGALIEQFKLTPAVKWIHLEVGVPQTTPGDAVGSPSDVVVHKNATVLFDKGDNKVEAFQMCEMVRVGQSWKLVDGPLPGHATPGSDATPDGSVVEPELREFLTELQAVAAPAGNSPAEAAKYHAARAAVLEKVVAKTQGAQQEPWLKQAIDAYAAGAESGDDRAMARLKQWQESITKNAPQSGLAGYAAFRIVTSEYGSRIGKAGGQDGVLKVQEWWRGQLEAFLKAFPGADDAPEACLRLAVACEFADKDGPAQAKGWYETLAKNYPNHPYAAKAHGSVRRLSSEGQPFALTGTQLGSGQPFSIGQLAGKPAVVYYWASWGQTTATELKQLGELSKLYKEKGLEIVTVNLDAEPTPAVAALNAAQVPGAHLYAPGGVDGSPLAAQYGVHMVPHVFLIGKDGKVVNRNAQPGPVLKDEVEKLVK